MRTWLIVGVGVLLLGGLVHAEELDVIDSMSAHEAGSTEELEENEHQPRHGGYFGDADDLYHYEVLLKPGNRIVLYVNDEHNHPLNTSELQGRWTLNPDSETPTEGVFTSQEEGIYLMADLPSISSDTVHIEVAVLKEETWARMEFYLPMEGAGTAWQP